jgi:hypothetical protein
MFYADLHNHTTASDGDYTPDALITSMKDLGVSVVGVTDHDTVGGLETALESGHALGVEVVPGVEVSVRFKESFFTGTLHLLCYFKPDLIRDHAFVTTLNATLGKGRGEALIRTRVAEINRCFGPGSKVPLLSRPMTHDEIAAYAPSVSRRHFAMALNEKHAITDPQQVNYIIGNKSPAYVPSGIDISTVEAFTSAFPVITVLAHPAAGSFPGEGHYSEVLPPVEIVERLLPRFLDMGLHGLEINYPGHTLNQQKMLQEWAEQYNLVATGGSDCHDQIHRPAGVAGISKHEFEIFKSCF